MKRGPTRSTLVPYTTLFRSSRVMIDTINGKRIETLEDVIAAFEENTKPQHMIQFISGTVECLDNTRAELANPEILSTYGIQTDRRL